MRLYQLHWLPPIPYLMASWPRRGDHQKDLAREQRRLLLAGFLASLALETSADESVWPAELLSFAASKGASGLADTPGILHAVCGQCHAFSAWQAEAQARRLEANGEPAEHLKAQAKTLYKKAAVDLWRSVQELPKCDDNVNDTTQHHSLVQSLALMLLANIAIKAGLQDRAWGGFGTAQSIATLAVRQQPSELYLRLEHAEILQLLKESKQALVVLAEARGLATDDTWRLQLAAKAGEVAVSSGQPLLLKQAETDFIRPLLRAGHKDRLIDLMPEEASVINMKANSLFVAGQVLFQLAATARDNPDQRLTVENREQARRAMFRFANAMEWMKQGRQQDPVNWERYPDWEMNVAGWRQAAGDLACEIALTLGDPHAALALAAELDATDPPPPFAALKTWTDRGMPDRFAAAALITRNPWADASQIAFRSLSRVLANRIQGDLVAMPDPPQSIVITMNQHQPGQGRLARRILGLSSAPTRGEHSGPSAVFNVNSAVWKSIDLLRVCTHWLLSMDREPTIPRLRDRLREHFGFSLPPVLLRTEGKEEESGRISIRIHGMEVAMLTPPAGAGIVLLEPDQAKRIGLTVLNAADPPPMLNGNPSAWVLRGWRSQLNFIPVLEPAFVLVGLLELAVFRAMDRLIGLDETKMILPNLSEDHLDRGLVVVRQLLREKRPLGRKDASAEITRRLQAGDDPAAVVAHLRALPGLRPLP